MSHPITHPKPCVGCNPPKSDMMAPPVQVVVPGVPQPRTAEEQFSQDLARNAVLQRHENGIDMDPDAGGSIPPWGVDLMNQVRAMRIELEALKHCLFGGIRLSPDEFNASRVAIVDAFERQFQAMAAQLGRQFAQRPQHISNTANPRRSPT